MKFKTGKPSRKSNPAPNILKDIDALELRARVPMREVPTYLACSLPTVYEMIRNNELESYTEGGRRFVTPRSIIRYRLPPHERPPLPKRAKPAKFVALRRVGRPSKSRRAVGAVA